MVRGILALGLTIGLAAASAPAGAIAQERVPTVEVRGILMKAPGARLGVYLEVGCEIESNVRGACNEAPRVRAVVDGSPADIAGILAGDTLLMLDGVSLLSEPGRRSLSQLRAGIPIEIEVGRESGRSTLRAIPSAREGNVRVSSRSGGVATLGAAPRAGFNVFRLRDDSGKVTEFQFGPESDGPHSVSDWVVFSPDVAGSMQVHVGDGEYAALMVDGESVMLAELEGHLVELSESLEVGVQELELDVAIGEVGEAVRRTLILDNPELARRLATIRVESMAAAREQLELLVERRAVLESRGEIPAGYSYSFQTRQAPRPGVPESPRVGVVMSGVPEATYRLGGAEFRVLTPELAEYFEVESGLLVLRVIPGTPVATLGLRGGDVVIEVGGREDLDMSMFRHLAASAEGDGVEVKWVRKGTSHTGRLAGR